LALPSEPEPGLLIVGLLAGDERLLAAAERALAEEIAAVTQRSADIAFDFTDYYESEMGRNLVRRWLCLAGRFHPGQLAGLKLRTNRLESRLLDSGRRLVNLDPGVLTRHNLVLASCKDFGHRVYLGRGVFAEVTLVYATGAYRPVDWTYPDYRSPECLDFMGRCRATIDRSG
jgi:hypothetical protein